MKIEKIKKIKNQYKIILEGDIEITTYDEIIIKNNILYKKDLDEKTIEEIKKQNEYYETYNVVLKYINKKIRSEYEIKEYIRKQNIKTEIEHKIIEKLKESKIINDTQYTKAYIHDRIKFSTDGPQKIKKELIKNKIDENIINNELEKIDKEELIKKLEKLINKKIKTNKTYSKKMLEQKLTTYFMNLGYKKEDIMTIIDNNIVEDNEIIKKEYDKLYNKLKNKYEKEKLIQIIKQKLYQKGFPIEQINNIKKDS